MTAPGIKIRSRVRNLRETLNLVYNLRNKGIPLADEDGSLVRVNHTVHGSQVPNATDAFRSCGLVSEPRDNGRFGVPLWWEPSTASSSPSLSP
jgi:hypothetical protein